MAEDSEPFLEKKNVHKKPSKWDPKSLAFFAIGVLTMVYVIGEIGIALWIDSLVLLSDGFHNLSDVVSLYIAYWAQQAGKRDISHEMSYGWKRTEILGGLTNGCFLLSLCLYVLLQSIPKFIKPEPMNDAGWLFIAVAAIGLTVNTVGTIVFAITGQGHSHSHGSGGHSHGHGHDHEHAHGHKKKDKDHKHKDKKKEKDHVAKTKSMLVSDQVPAAITSSFAKLPTHEMEIVEEDSSEKHKHKHEHKHDHKHKEKKEKKQKEKHKAEKKKKKDMNVHAVFLHYLGDALSSVLVLGAGLLIHFFHGGAWTEYVDPVSSLVIVIFILWTTVPLVKHCSLILLQSTPNDVQIEEIQDKMRKLEGLVSVHDFHVWQLVDGIVIASVHVTVEEGADFMGLSSDIKKIFHKFGIHSTCIQPEFVPRTFQDLAFCEQNCVKECEEDWCCKTTAEKKLSSMEEFSIKSSL